MTTGPRLCIALTLVALCASVSTAQVTPEQIDKAVADGVASLLKTQRPNGGWGDYDSGIPDFGQFGRGGGFGRRGRDGGDRRNNNDGPQTIIFEHGQDVAGLLGLAYSGFDIADPRMKKAIDLVLKVEVTKNYVLGMRVLALARLHDRLAGRQRQLARKVVANDVAALVANQNKQGLWSYGAAGRNSDMGDTGMAIAAMGEAATIMKPRKSDLWAISLKSLMDHQKDDGQWTYLRMSMGPWGDFDVGSTAANGVAGLLNLRTVVFKGGGCPCKEGRSAITGTEANGAIERGLEWMGQNPNPPRAGGGGGGAGGGGNRVSIRSAEWAFFWARCGVLSGRRSFGGQPWYPRLAATVMGQQEDGSWGDTVRTGLSLAGLATGREPILVHKLRMDGSAWNRHPDDLARMVDHVATRKNERLRWQIADLDMQVDELHEAPLLYLSVEAVPSLTGEQKRKLRQFTDTGGTIMIEASCGDKSVADWCDKTCAEIWPEWPLAALPHEHDLWRADQRMGARHPVLSGVDDGMRACVIVSRHDLSCQWATGDTRKNFETFRLAQNLYAYTIDRTPIRSKWQTPPEPDERYTGQQLKRGGRDAITVARIKHAGDWNVGANYLPWKSVAEAPALTGIGLTVSTGQPIEVGKEIDAKIDLLYLTGRRSCDLGEDGAEWLRTAVDAGKFLLVEAAMGDARFNTSVREALAAGGLELKLFPADAPPLTGKLFDANGYALNNVQYSVGLEEERKKKSLAALPEGQAWPKDVPVVLYGIYAGKKLVGIYSPFDILFSQTGTKAFGRMGYSVEDARAMITNLLLLMTVR